MITLLHMANEQTVKLKENECSMRVLRSAFARNVGDTVSMGGDRDWEIVAMDWFAAPTLNGSDRINYCYVLPKGESVADPRAEQQWWRDRFPDHSAIFSEEEGKTLSSGTEPEPDTYEIGSTFSLSFTDPETDLIRLNRSFVVAGVKTYFPVGDSPIASVRFVNLVKAHKMAELMLVAA